MNNFNYSQLQSSNNSPSVSFNDEHSGYFFSRAIEVIGKNLGLASCVIQSQRFAKSFSFVENILSDNQTYIRQYKDDQGEVFLTINAVFEIENDRSIKFFFAAIQELFQSFFKTELRIKPEIDQAFLCPFFIDNQEFIKRIAQSISPVLIFGESGTGKEFLAKLIHDKQFEDSPFVIISLANIPDALFEMELFGYEKGAFTDAYDKKAGKLSLAGKGTLVLDNVDCLSVFQQSKLLRVLQDGSYYPIGSNQLVKMQCRIIAISSVKLEGLVAAGKFREDLFYRLNVVPFYIPPLKSRPLDIDYFVNKFIKDASGIRDQGVHLSANLQIYLRNHSWPGNIRELMNFLEYSLVNSIEGLLDIPSITDTKEAQKTLKDAITLCKKNTIHDTLLRCNGNQTNAAKILGIQRTYLARLIKDFSSKT